MHGADSVHRDGPHAAVPAHDCSPVKPEAIITIISALNITRTWSHFRARHYDTSALALVPREREKHLKKIHKFRRPYMTDESNKTGNAPAGRSHYTAEISMRPWCFKHHLLTYLPFHHQHHSSHLPSLSPLLTNWGHNSQIGVCQIVCSSCLLLRREERLPRRRRREWKLTAAIPPLWTPVVTFTVIIVGFEVVVVLLLSCVDIQVRVFSIWCVWVFVGFVGFVRFSLEVPFLKERSKLFMALFLVFHRWEFPWML